MIETPKQGPGTTFTVELSRKELDLLLLGAKKDKRSKEDQARWLFETYGLGLLKYTEEGAESRTLLRANHGQGKMHYPDGVSVSTSRAGDKE